MAYSPVDNSDDFGGRASTWDLIELLESGKPNSPIYMQYTGLKDKNGVEIYEGDIVSHSEYGIAKVAWNGYMAANDQYGWGISLELVRETDGIEDSVFAAECWPTQKQCEVIGNIYENPELLKGNE